jgi:hypothetical protein
MAVFMRRVCHTVQSLYRPINTLTTPGKPLRCQETLDAMHHPLPVTLCGQECSMELSAVFFSHAWHVDDTPPLKIAAYP